MTASTYPVKLIENLRKEIEGLKEENKFILKCVLHHAGPTLTHEIIDEVITRCRVDKSF